MTKHETKYLRNKKFINTNGETESHPVIDVKELNGRVDYLLYDVSADKAIMVVGEQEDCRLTANSIHLIYPYNENTTDILLRIEQLKIKS